MNNSRRRHTIGHRWAESRSACPPQHWDDHYFDKENILPVATSLPKRSIHSEEGRACALQPLSAERCQALGVVLDTTDEDLEYETFEEPWVEGTDNAGRIEQNAVQGRRDATLETASGSAKCGHFWGLLDMLKVRSRKHRHIWRQHNHCADCSTLAAFICDTLPLMKLENAMQ